jgi:hypothetical protein
MLSGIEDAAVDVTDTDLPMPLCTAVSGARIVLRTIQAARWSGIAFNSAWGPDIAVSNGDRGGLIEFHIQAESGAYELWIEFAAAESRPIQIVLDGLPIMRDAAAGTTGGWSPANQVWCRQIRLALRAGGHVIELSRDGAFPHIRRIALLPVVEATPAEIARVAAELRISARAAALEEADVEDVIRTMAPLLRRLFSRRRSTQIVASLLTELAAAVEKDVSEPQERIGFLGPFNGQRRRQEIFNRLDAMLGFDVMIETGAYLGTTTEMLAGLGRPVYSCELDRAMFMRSAVRLAEYNNVKLYNKDSRTFLKELFQTNSSWKMPFFYLDAHWGPDLPLADEISLIVADFAEFVICVDDFKHPDPGYGYDRYSDETELSLENLRPRLSLGSKPMFLYPAAPAETETGARRGTLFIVPLSLYTSLLQGEPLLTAA